MENTIITPKITHVIFDMGGLLFNTEEIYTMAQDQIANEYGKICSPDIKVKMMGRGQFDSCAVAVESMELPLTAEEFLTRLTVIVERLLPDCTFLPGAKEVVEQFHDAGIPMAIATGCNLHDYNLKVDKHYSEFFAKYFRHTVHASKEFRSKPAPDIFQVCARKFDNPPCASLENVLVFEDSVNGVAGALVAGMYCVWVPSIPEAMDTENFLTSSPILQKAMTYATDGGGIDFTKKENVEKLKTRLTVLNSLKDFEIDKFT